MPSFIEIGQVVHIPLEKGRALHLNKLEFPSPKVDLCQVLVEIGPVVLEKIFQIGQCIFAFS